MALFGKGKKGKKKEEKDETEEDTPKEEKEEGTENEGADADAEGEGGEGDGGGDSKKSKKKIIIFGILALVLIGGGAGGAYYAGLFGGDDKKDGESHKEEGATQAVYYTMPEFLVNLNSGGKASSFLKTTVILELEGQTDVLVVEANLPRLMDAVNTYLRELRSSDLAGSAGIQRLREELMLRINKTLAPTEINNVLFKEIVVQ